MSGTPLLARAAIILSVDGFRAAFNAADVGAIAAYQADDLVKLRQGSPVICPRTTRPGEEQLGHRLLVSRKPIPETLHVW